MQHEMGEDPRSPSAMSNRLARHGYKADSIDRAIRGHFNLAYPMEIIEKAVANEENRRPDYVSTYLNKAESLHKPDTEFRYMMELGSAALHCELWRAGFRGKHSVQPDIDQMRLHGEWYRGRK